MSSKVKVLYQHTTSSSSEEPPMDEWSSLIIARATDNPKRALYEEGLYDPGSGEICTKYVSLSASSVLRHAYYNYPGITDPGIVNALLKPEPLKIYDYDGQELYLDLCDQMNVCPVRDFYRGLVKEAIDLKYYAVNPRGVRAMAMALSNNKYVKRLDLTGSFLNLDACYHLGQLLGESFALQELVLCSCKLQPAGLRSLVVMLSKRSMELLDLSRNDITDKGLMFLTRQIRRGAVIKRLSLSYNDLGADGAVALAEAYAINNKATHFDISWNKIFPPRGANLLIRTLGDNKALREVNLSWNGLTVGIPLRKLLTVTTLKILDLSNNKLSTDAANAIALRLPNATGLKTLDLSNNPFRPADALIVLLTLKQSEVKLRKLLMDNIVVNRAFIAEKEEILNLPFRAKTRITHGPVTKNYTLSVPDMRLIVMKRIDFLTSRATKKCKLDIALYFLRARKTNDGPDMMTRELYKSLMYAGAPMEMGLIEEMANVFPGKPGDKGVVEYVRRMWPDKQLPQEPPPPPPTKGGKKGKKKR
ncbi:leucine-rich repeat-containing protein 74A isoform X2 [Manduca sexta]|uniref:Uncharacterized protein n=1 Tax=Manduca sexta TaxID=7130 RepID=A0A921ZS79_MANSE|nr:leucine-rich repeat-containing protein 74A isoform X2 [Manduca sexta]KAG6463410.1 hypothetical protein O3G_MSEX013858 [Manduca sexta]